MSHTIRFNEGLGVIVLRAKQQINAIEIVSALEEILLIPDFKPGLSLVVDLRGGDIRLTADEVRIIANAAKFAEDRWGDTKCAILASNNDSYGLGRMFMSLTDQHQLESHVFRTALEADGWLGLGVEMVDILERTPE